MKETEITRRKRGWKRITMNFVTKPRYTQAIKQCMDLAIARNEKYGNSINVMANSSVVDIVLMKLTRTKNLKTTDPKYLDELIDSINYLVYLLMREKSNFYKK